MIALRPPAQVMRLSRLGSAHQTRLSFMRVLLRKMRQAGWRTDRPIWQIDARGIGHAVYRVQGSGQCYSLIAFAHDLPDDQRSDRVIAEAWDATFTLMDGTPTADDLTRLAANVPLQEAGRISEKELVLSRANRSVRLWDHVVDRLASGAQPDPALVDNVGYLMRTTAVYGSGKFGAADFQSLANRPVIGGPFRAEMLTVWLIRAFVLDLVEHVAKQRGGDKAVPLAPVMRQRFGIGNSTGLGMAPFLVNHPELLNAWITARETALARVRGLSSFDPDRWRAFVTAFHKTQTLVASWTSTHPVQVQKLQDLRGDLDKMSAVLNTPPKSWDALWGWGAASLSEEGQELLLSLMLEPFGDLVDDLADGMGCNETDGARIDGAMTLGDLGDLITANYGWALGDDYEKPQDCARFWYVSQAKLEPRLGERFDEPGQDLEQPLDMARAVAALAEDLNASAPDLRVAAFLQSHPVHRRIVRRVQLSRQAPYLEIRDNLISADLMPIDMLRCKLSFFGATRFDPRSDRWVRITMFQNAPFPDELLDGDADDWALPDLAGAA